MNHSTIDEPLKNLPKSNSNQSTSYVLGALIFILFMSAFSLIRDVSEPIGIAVKSNLYTAAWIGGVVALIFSCVGCYLTSKRIAKIHLSNGYKPVKQIVYLSILIIVLFVIKIWSGYATNSYYNQLMQGKFGFFYTMNYTNFKQNFSPILSGIGAISLLITLGVKK